MADVFSALAQSGNLRHLPLGYQVAQVFVSVPSVLCEKLMSWHLKFFGCTLSHNKPFIKKNIKEHS